MSCGHIPGGAPQGATRSPTPPRLKLATAETKGARFWRAPFSKPVQSDRSSSSAARVLALSLPHGCTEGNQTGTEERQRSRFGRVHQTMQVEGSEGPWTECDHCVFGNGERLPAAVREGQGLCVRKGAAQGTVTQRWPSQPALYVGEVDILRR